MAAGMCGKGFLGSGVVTTSYPPGVIVVRPSVSATHASFEIVGRSAFCVRRVWDICGVRHWEHPEDYWGTPHGPAFPVHSPGAGPL